MLQRAGAPGLIEAAATARDSSFDESVGREHAHRYLCAGFVLD